MSSKTKKYFFYTSLIFLFIVLGFMRDFIFINLNYQMGKLYYKDYNFILPEPLYFLNNFTYQGLIYLKWILTGIFFILYFLVTVLSIKRIFNNKKYIKLSIGFYFILTVVAALVYLIGAVFFNSERAYNLSLFFTHMIQSPLVLMILIPAFKLTGNAKKPKD